MDLDPIIIMGIYKIIDSFLIGIWNEVTLFLWRIQNFTTFLAQHVLAGPPK